MYMQMVQGSTPTNRTLLQSIGIEKDKLNCCMTPLRLYHKNIVDSK